MDFMEQQLKYIAEGVDNYVNLLLDIGGDMAKGAAHAAGSVAGAAAGAAASVKDRAIAGFSPSSSPNPSRGGDGVAQARSVTAQAPLGRGEDLNTIASNRDRMPEIAATLNDYNYELGNFSPAAALDVRDKSQSVGLA